ncbi:hypothetical protein Bca4012_058046 [Brassica carinata]
MSSPQSSTSSSSTPPSTRANNPKREEEPATQQPNSVAVPLDHQHHDPDAEVVALRPRKFLEAGKCTLCGKEFTQERNRDIGNSQEKARQRK